MKKLMLGMLLAGITIGPVGATTKPTDLIQVQALPYDPQDTGKPQKIYIKAWKDLNLDTATRQKILAVEKRFEAENPEDKLRIYAIRTVTDKNGRVSVSRALYITQFGMLAYEFWNNSFCRLHIDGNGTIFSGSGPNGECTL